MYRLCLNIKILKKLFLNGALMITGYSTGPQGMKKKKRKEQRNTSQQQKLQENFTRQYRETIRLKNTTILIQ